MSMHLDFEPHSWYMGAAIEYRPSFPRMIAWCAYIENGNTYQINTLCAGSLKAQKKAIRDYHLRHHTGYGERLAKRRLDYLRAELRAEQLSYGDLSELQSLTNYINKDDTELLEAAGVEEN